MIKQVYIVLFFLIGLFLTPTISYACEKELEKECCTAHQQSSEDNDCCQKSQNSEKEDCTQKCKSDVCHCSHFSFHVFFSYQHNLTPSYCSSFIIEQKTVYIQTYFSTAFYSIWTPPKIA